MHDAGLETTFEQRTAAPVTMVEAPDVTPTQILHAARDGIRQRWRSEQVYVVGHEYPGMHVDEVLLSSIAQPVSVRLAIGVVGEACLPVVTPLNYVNR